MKQREYSMCVRHPIIRPCFSYLCASVQLETRCEVSACIRVCRLCLIVWNWQCLRGVLKAAYTLIPQGRVQWSWITKQARHASGKIQTLFSQAVSFNIALQCQRNYLIHLASFVYGLHNPSKQGDRIREIFSVFPSVLSLGLSLQSEPCPCMLFHMELSYYLC